MLVVKKKTKKKQGDVISPLLFNAGIEATFRAWRNRLRDHGFLMAPNTTKFTNTRYVDDVMLFVKSMEETVEMVESLKCWSAEDC